MGFQMEGGRLRSSHPRFEALADSLSSHPDFDNHRALFLARGPESGQLHSVSLHRIRRGPGAGGVRRLPFGTLNDMVTDGMRLAIGMGYKNALAGLWWGGGKGVIGLHDSGADKDTVYREFGRFVSALNGCYVSAEDVGTKPEDMATVFSATRFTTCIPAQVGGSGNPSGATARGVFMGIQALARHWGRELQGMTVALQGLGEVGSRLARYLHEAGVDMTVFDPEADKMERVLALGERHKAGSAESILFEEVDVLSPCALGAVLTPESVPRLRCRGICGAANNQLQVSERDSELLHERGISYLPDFVVNRMGIVNCADEQYGRLEPDPKIERHFGWEWDNAIAPLCVRLLAEAEERGETPLLQADRLAREAMSVDHPLWPGRAEEIARYTFELMRDGKFRF